MSESNEPVLPHQPLRRRLGVALALVAASTLSACIMVPVGRRQGRPADDRYGRYDDGDDDGDVVTVAPPPPQLEVVIAAPGPGFFWIAGHWGWLGGRHAWIGGRWQAHRQGWRWQPYGWTRHRRGWRARPGRWYRD